MSKNEKSTINNNMYGSRITWLDSLKGIGIILVLLGHIYNNDFVFNFVYSFHMPVFFFAAGYVYKDRPILIDLKRRIDTIVRPYFIFGGSVLIYWIFVERRFRESNCSISQAIIGLFLGQYTKLDFNVHLWFLPCFFVTVILFNIFTKEFGIKISYCIAIVLCVINIVLPVPEIPWGIDRMCKYIVFYAIGNWIHSKHQLFFNTNKVVHKISMIAVGVILLAFLWMLNQVSYLEHILWYVKALIGITSCVFISISTNNAILQYLGKASIVVLSFHGPIYRVVIKIESVLLKCQTDEIRTNIIYVISVIIATLFCCMMIYQAIVRLCPWIIGRIKIEEKNMQDG